MYGLTRGTMTLLGAAAAGLLVWLATQVNDSSNGGYWAVYGLIAAAGLTMAFSQILGGWTKWGWPRLSLNVFLLAFVPVLIAAGWVLVFGQPDPNWFRDHIRAWSGDISIDGLVRDLTEYVAVLGFGIGLVFGFTFDTSGPAAYGPFGRRRRTVATPAGGAARRSVERSDEPVAEDREPVTTGAPVQRDD
jgi:drug/metabolite transporter superfamily protein YnfA